MLRCKIFDFFFFVFPLKSWQDFLIRRHFQKCPVCQEKLTSMEEAKSFLIQESEVESLEVSWPAIRGKLSEEKRKDKHVFWPRLKWIAGAATLCAAIVIGIWLYLVYTPDKGPSEEDLGERFQINYIKIGDKPARAFLFYPHDSNMIIVWAEKNT